MRVQYFGPGIRVTINDRIEDGRERFDVVGWVAAQAMDGTFAPSQAEAVRWEAFKGEQIAADASIGVFPTRAAALEAVAALITDEGQSVLPSGRDRHTPGPWHIDGDRGLIYATAPGDNNEIHVCLYDDDHDRAGADARLIASAPDLLAVGKQLQEWSARMGGFEAPVWDELRTILLRIEPPEDEA